MNQITERRKAAGLTLDELAERSGVSAIQLWRWETGRTSRPRPENLARVLSALDEVDQTITTASWTDHAYVVATHPITTAAIGVIVGILIGGAL